MKNILLTMLLSVTAAFAAPVDDRFILLRNDHFLVGRNFADSADISTIKVGTDNSVQISTGLKVTTAGKVVFTGSNALTLTSLASDPGSPVAGDVYYNSVSNLIKFYNGSSWLSLSTGSGSFANTTLSNIINTIALPDGVHLTPANSGQVNLGSSSKHFNSTYSDSLLTGSIFGTTTGVAVVLPNTQILRSDTGSINQINWSGVWNSPNSSSNGIGINKQMRLCTNCSNAGSDYISFGAPASFTGPLLFTLPGTNGSSGQFLQTDGTGVTSWASVSGFANTTLTNLGTIGATLLPTDLTYGLGDASHRWLSANISTVSSSQIAAASNGDLSLSSSAAGTIVYLSPNSATDFSNKPTRHISRLGLFRSFDYNIEPPQSPSSGYTLYLPPAQCASNEVMKNDGSGNLSCAADVGITQLTGDVTAGPGNGSQAATVAKLQGRDVSSAAPSSADVLTWNSTSSAWEPKSAPAPTGDIVPDVTGTRSIGSSSVEYLAQWTRAVKGITNILVQAVSGNATVQGTNVVLSNGTNTLTFTGTNLNPSVNNAISLGSAANNIFALGRFRSVSAGDGTSTLLQMDGTAGQTFPGGQSISGSLRNTTNTGTHIGIYSTNNTTANTVATGDLYIGTGNKLAGNANSGDMILRIGTPFGTGVRGTLAIQDGSEGSSHYLWSSTDTTGKGTWVATLQDASDVNSFNHFDRQEFDTAGSISHDWNVRTHYDSTTQPSDDYENRIDFDNGGLTSHAWSARQFTANDGSTVNLDYSNPAGINLNSTVLTNPAGGSGTIPTLTTTFNVSDARVTTGSQVIVTLQTAAASVVQSVVSNSGSFDINLTASVVATLDFKYTIVESPQ